MTTTDPFIEAARAEAERRWPRLPHDPSGHYLNMGKRIGFDLGAQWAAALPYAIATIWAFLYAAHSCPTPVPDAVDRGEPCLHLIGGPEDGGQYAIEGLTRDMAGARLMVEGTPYTVTEIRSTCYTAEVER